jgi:ATP-dependent RNA helicase DeaD
MATKRKTPPEEGAAPSSSESAPRPRKPKAPSREVESGDPPSATEGLGFAELGLEPTVLAAVVELGYERPSPIQAAAIPPLLEGRDLLGQAQTGTGKTAAFALPLLSRLDVGRRTPPQILVLTPTRELAIQVAEAMSSYARKIPGFHVLPVYGGQAIAVQLRPLARGVHAVVGTPGRILDHLERGTLDLGGIRSVVLDEADEMLRMGFLDEVEAILGRTPEGAQVALFSATMPPAIARIARKRLVDPVEVRIESETTTVAAIRQLWWEAAGAHKLDALTRILEIGDFDAVLVFVRTRIAAVELSEKLEARGYACGSLHGDMSQPLREKTVERLKAGALDIVVATDVAARGLDVERISHVINYDLPPDVESYVHRIGRTGRAGRSGEAILFVTPRERRLLEVIQRSTGQQIERFRMPSLSDIVDKRVARFKDEITEALTTAELDRFVSIVQSYRDEHDTPFEQIAGALAFLAQRERPLVPDLPELPASRPPRPERPPREDRGQDRGPRGESWEPRGGFEWRAWRVDVGREQGVLPANLVGAIANEIGIASRFIGRIDIRDHFSVVELPGDLPRAAIEHLSGVVVRGRPLGLRPFQPSAYPSPERRDRDARPPRDREPRAPRDRGDSAVGQAPWRPFPKRPKRKP